MDTDKTFNKPEFHILQEDDQDVLNSINNCCLCGTDLIFDHKTDHINLTVKEEANCPACGIRTKSQYYSIQ